MPQTFTYQTRIKGEQPELDAYAELYGKVERALYADVQRGKTSASCKNEYLKRFGIPARMFNAIRIGLEGKIKSVQALQADRVPELESRINKAKKVISKLKDSAKAHQKKRRLHILETKLEALKNDLEEGKTRIAFGSKKLWRAQFALEANGYASHEAWLRDWKAARSNEIFSVGSSDETAGNIMVSAFQDEEGIRLRIRLPDCLSIGKHIEVGPLTFAYGQEALENALASNHQYRAIKNSSRYKNASEGDRAARASGYGIPLTYRFKKDKKGWRVFVSVEYPHVEITTDKKLGAIGVDLNADHLAVSETDRFGNPISSRRVDLVTYGLSMDKANALIGDACASIVKQAKEAGKPIVIERLDFRKKKAQMEDEGRRYERMLSSLSYNKIKQTLKARAYRNGVSVREVNPAFTSVIGRVKYAERYGLSVHQAAALVIAQRYLRISERLPSHRIAPDGKGGHVTFCVSVRKRMKHVWSSWSSVSKTLKAALVAQHRRTNGSSPLVYPSTAPAVVVV